VASRFLVWQCTTIVWGRLVVSSSLSTPTPPPPPHHHRHHLELHQLRQLLSPQRRRAGPLPRNLRRVLGWARVVRLPSSSPLALVLICSCSSGPTGHERGVRPCASLPTPCMRRTRRLRACGCVCVGGGGWARQVTCALAFPPPSHQIRTPITCPFRRAAPLPLFPPSFRPPPIEYAFKGAAHFPSR
jgi:hypothetical protein